MVIKLINIVFLIVMMYTEFPNVTNFSAAVKEECLEVSFNIEKFVEELIELEASYTVSISCSSLQSKNAKIFVENTSMTNNLIICSSNMTYNDSNTVGEILNNCSSLLLSPILSVNG